MIRHENSGYIPCVDSKSFCFSLGLRIPDPTSRFLFRFLLSFQKSARIKLRNCSNSGEISQKLENWSSNKTTKSDRIEKSNKIAKVGQNWKIGKNWKVEILIRLQDLTEMTEKTLINSKKCHYKNIITNVKYKKCQPLHIFAGLAIIVYFRDKIDDYYKALKNERQSTIRSFFVKFHEIWLSSPSAPSFPSIPAA